MRNTLIKALTIQPMTNCPRLTLNRLALGLDSLISGHLPHKKLNRYQLFAGVRNGNIERNIINVCTDNFSVNFSEDNLVNKQSIRKAK